MVRRFVTISIITILCLQSAQGNTIRDTTEAETQTQRRPYAPHFMPVQYAGNIGYISTGIGYVASRDKYHFSLQYGFSPKSVSGVEIHTLTFRNVFHLYKYPVRENTIIPYAALGISLEVGGRSFFLLPDNMPKAYYRFPKSIHAIPAIGIKLRHPTNQIAMLRAVEIFAEATTVDAYIWYKAISSEVRMNQIVSLSIGINLMR